MNNIITNDEITSKTLKSITLKKENGVLMNGVILGDEMGMGKTAQTIGLIYNLLNHGPKKKRMKKILIVSTSSLVAHWRKEIKLWLNDTRLLPLICTSKTHKKSPQETINDFKNGYFPVLLISYSLAAMNIHLLKTCKINLLVCDEGHKLKNRNTNLYQALNSLQTFKRIIITGTPIQNNLLEFYDVIEFINPGSIGGKKFFLSFFENPINKGKDSSASLETKKLGNQRSKILSSFISTFFIRRTMKSLESQLPPKMVINVFTKFSSLQKELYKVYLDSYYLQLGEGWDTDDGENRLNALSCVQSLKQLICHPLMVFNKISENKIDEVSTISDQLSALSKKGKKKKKKKKKVEEDEIDLDEEEEEDDDGLFDKLRKKFPSKYHKEYKLQDSKKLDLLFSMLEKFKNLREKTVVVSNFTSILDTIQLFLNQKSIKFVRLDGSLSVTKRNERIESFNRPNSSYQVFLLSARAGACGINLYGASRLVIFDPDWNPSVDYQAMARIWRDGQKRDCFIYRFISVGSVEEKIFQRQIMKTQLSNTIIAKKGKKGKEKGKSFSREMLKELFSYNLDESCETFLKEATLSNGLNRMKRLDRPFYDAVKENDSVLSFVKVNEDTKNSKTDEIEEEENESEKEEIEGDDNEVEIPKKDDFFGLEDEDDDDFVIEDKLHNKKIGFSKETKEEEIYNVRKRRKIEN